MAAGHWSKSTETINGSGKQLNNIYNKCTFSADTWSSDHDAEETKDFNFATKEELEKLGNPYHKGP